MGDGAGLTRREMLADSVAGSLAGFALLTTRNASVAQPPDAATKSFTTGGKTEFSLPPHRPLHVDGVHAYSRHSVTAGGQIDFHCSSTVDYRFQLVKLGPYPHSDAPDTVLVEEVGKSDPQPIHPGSYLLVSKIPPIRLRRPFAIAIWIRPFRLDGDRQSIISRNGNKEHDPFSLDLDAGRLVFEAHDAVSLRSDRDLESRVWNSIVVTGASGRIELWLNGQQVATGSIALDEQMPLENAPEEDTTPSTLRIGASLLDGLADRFFDGDVACCALYASALTADSIQEFASARGLKTCQNPAPVAYWNFSEEQGDVVRDVSEQKRYDAQIINHGTWMIGGPSFDQANVDKYDAGYDPRRDPRRGHGLRLASDDLYDCRWPVKHRVQIPTDAKPGFYCGRFEYEANGETYQHNATFVVKRALTAPKAEILVLAANNTWRAYNWFPFARNRPSGRWNWTQAAVADSGQDESLPSYCLYRDHQSGQPTYQVGVNLPCETADPYRCYRGSPFWGQWVACEHLVHLWLDRQGYRFDVVTDEDLETEPEQLEGRNTLFIAGHSEYWSAKAYNALEKFLDQGGNLATLSANSLFWRVEYEVPGRMDCRKNGPKVLGSEWTQPGELYHGVDKARGGLMRFCGMPAWKLIGLETAGWCAGMDFLPYTAVNADHPLFHTPYDVGVAAEEEFGFFHETGVVGHEYDVRPSILVKATQQMPPGYENVRDPDGITVLAECRSDRKIMCYHADGNLTCDNPAGVLSEIIYWERPNGGRVFNIGAVAAPWGLYFDERISRLMQNVLHQFGIKN